MNDHSDDYNVSRGAVTKEHVVSSNESSSTAIISALNGGADVVVAAVTKNISSMGDLDDAVLEDNPDVPVVVDLNVYSAVIDDNAEVLDAAGIDIDTLISDDCPGAFDDDGTSVMTIVHLMEGDALPITVANILTDNCYSHYIHATYKR